MAHRNGTGRKSLPPIDIRDKRLRGGRLTIASGARTATERKDREAAIRNAIEAGEVELVEAVRTRQIAPSELVAAFRKVARGERDELELLRARAHGRDVRLGAALDDLLQTIRATHPVGGTWKRYFDCAKAIRAAFGEDRLLAAVTREEVRAFLHEPKPKYRRPWAPTHQRQHRQFGARLWTLHGFPESRNPWKQVETPKPRKTRVVFLQPTEWATVARLAEDTPELAALALGCLAGLRQGEVAHLRTDLDVDFEARVVRIQPRKGEFPWRPKTDNSIRVVPMCAALEQILRRHVALGFAGDRYFIRRPKRDRPIREKLLADWTRRAFTAAGIQYGQERDGLTNHSLRHTFATWLLLRKAAVQVVAKLMGDTVEMVLTTYAHLLDEDLTRAVDVLDAAVADSRPLSGESSGAAATKTEKTAPLRAKRGVK